MKINAIVGNPPYQENIGIGGGNSSLSKQVFPHFIINTIKCDSDYVSLITPSRYFTGNAQDRSFPKLRKFMRENNHFSHIFHFENEKEIFPQCEIKGGLSYFVYDKKHIGEIQFYNCKNNMISMVKRKLFEDGLDVILADNFYPILLNKVLTDNFHSLSQMAKGRNAFGIVGKESVVKEVSKKEYFQGACELRCKANVIRYITPDKVTKNIELFKNKYKVFISKSSGAPNKDKSVIRHPYVGGKNTACTDSLIPIGCFDTREEAENLQKYMYSKFLRFMVRMLKSSQNLYQGTYQFVPLQDFTSKSDIDWSQTIKNIDRQLYKKYNLNDEEISYIEEKIIDF